MFHPPPCIRYDEIGPENCRLRALFDQARKAVGAALEGRLLALYDNNDFLIVSWSDSGAREQWGLLIADLWAARSGGAPLMQLVPSDESFEYDEDDLDPG